MPQQWVRKPGSPDYTKVTTADVWGQVKAKWSSLGSPDAQCPSPQFGEPGSPRNNACRQSVGNLWDRFEDVIPDLPETAPHYSIVDLVPTEEVCALGYYDDPEADIGNLPNLFENPGALAQKLQEWYLRSLIPTLCEPVPSPPLEGGCFCWPYFVTVKFEVRRYQTGEWEEVQSTSPVFGPFRGVGWKLVESESTPFPGVNVFIRGQENAGGFRFGGLDTCTLGVQEYITFGGSNSDQVRSLSVVNVIPFTISDIDFYGLSGSTGFVPTSEFCPTPQGLPPLKDYPNTRPVYMPLPIPQFVFPAAPGCPVGQEDYLIFNVNVEGSEGPPGPKGEDGEQGKDGPTMIETVIAASAPQMIGDTSPGDGALGGAFSVPRDCAGVEVKFKVPTVEEGLIRERRVFFDPPEGGNYRVEGSWGNAHLVLSGSEQGSLERVQFSRLVTLIEVPRCPDSRDWTLIVVDKGDQGIEVWDTGLRHCLRKVSNPDDVPTVEYSGP